MRILSRIFAIAGLIAAAFLTATGRPGAFWFFFVGAVIALALDVEAKALQAWHDARLREAEKRNEEIAKSLAELNKQVQGDIRDLKTKVLELSVPTFIRD